MRPDMVAVSPPGWVRYRWGKARRGVKTGTGKKGQMARGFWTGFLHGGLVGVTALAALLLAVPLPQPDAEAGAQPAQATVLPVAPDTPATAEVPEDSPVPQSGEAEEAVAAPPPAGTPQADVPVADPPPADAPVAGAVDLPVGSEFGRGGDLAPSLPASLASDRPAVAEAPAVMAPTSEPAPVAITMPDPRPQPAGDQDGPVQGAPIAGEDAPQLDRPATLARPGLPLLPGRAAAEGPDAVPLMPLDLPGTPSAPGLPAPVLDLSLPPDLSDLQGLSRD